MQKKRNSHMKKAARKAKTDVVIGTRRFAKISAVEGIVLTSEMRTRSTEFDRKGMSAKERRQSIVRVYRKG